MFDIIAREHDQLHHPGIKPTYRAVADKYHYISRDEVEWVLEHCGHCLLQAPNHTRAPLCPIASDAAMERVQIDLIDMRSAPDGEYHWIPHIKDHFTKISQAYALKNKASQEVSEAIDHWAGFVGIPWLIQSDNGNESLGKALRVLGRYDIQVRLFIIIMTSH